MQAVSKHVRHRFGIAEPLAVVLAAGVAIVAVSRAEVRPRDGSAEHVGFARAIPTAVPDDVARVIADMMLHD